jgi:hypothetical protein
MANTRTTRSGRRARRTASHGGLPWVSELQLDAYLEARDALRRARARASMTRPSQSPPVAS